MKSLEEMIAAAQEAAQTIQSQMEQAQAGLDKIEVEGVSGGGLVKVRATAKGRILGVAIDDSLMQADGIHANGKGVAKIVASIMPKVDELLARVKPRD